MQIICNNCGYTVNRDKYINGVLIEEYKNIYGTCCPKCGFFIKNTKKTNFSEEKENNRLKFASIIIGKLRKKILGDI